MLAGFVVMFALSWFYLTVGIGTPMFQDIFLGFQAAVVALIVRAVHRIGGHALHDRWLMGIASVVLVAQLLGIHFAITLLLAELAYVLVSRSWSRAAIALGLAFLVGMVLYTFSGPGRQPTPSSNRVLRRRRAPRRSLRS